MSIVSDADWIAALSAPIRADIRARMRPSRFVRGETAYATGQPPRGVNQVREGYVKLLGLDEDGRQPLIVIYGPGAVFSETAVVSERPHNHTLVAMTPCIVDQLPSDAFWTLYRRHAEIPEALCRKFAMIISNQVQGREQRAHSSLRRLVAGVFSDLADHCAKGAPADQVVIKPPLSQSEIGDFLHVTRQSVQREITELKAGKLLDKRDGRWIVLDRKRLQRLAGASPDSGRLPAAASEFV